MIPALKMETENFHGKSHPEVIKVHRWEKIGGNKFGEKNGLPTPQKVVTGITV